MGLGELINDIILRDKGFSSYDIRMPSGPGLRNALIKMGAGPHGKKRIVWTSLREEPVLVSFNIFEILSFSRIM